MYKRIAQHPGTRKLYADRLEAEGVIAPPRDELVTSTRAASDAGKPTNAKIRYGLKPALAVDWGAVPRDRLAPRGRHGRAEGEAAPAGRALTTVPESVEGPSERGAHPRHAPGDGRGQGRARLGHGENLAYASLVDGGHPVRLSGQDCGRGTFAHRHAVIHDQNREKWDSGVYVPLQNIRQGQANFVVIDSLLSEEAVLGFEYGYSTAQPFELVIWEGQFGDFANGRPGGDRPVHRRGRGEVAAPVRPHDVPAARLRGAGPGALVGSPRALPAALREHNIQVCVPSTAAQFFHMIRRQVIRPMRKPLIVMTPKSLLRKKEAASPLEDLATGAFQNVIPEVEKLNAKKVRRVVFCSGKVYYDIVAERARRAIDDIAVVRVEQLYPFPHEEFAAEVARYPGAKSIVWCQEEPANQGAWRSITHYLQRHLRDDQLLSYAGRASAASPAVGYLALHNEQQKALVEAALSWDVKASQEAA
jgi:2-oxoglutarate dehydrogenase E1 component